MHILYAHLLLAVTREGTALLVSAKYFSVTSAGELCATVA